MSKEIIIKRKLDEYESICEYVAAYSNNFNYFKRITDLVYKGLMEEAAEEYEDD